MDHIERILSQWRRERPDLDVAPMGTIGRIKLLNQILVQAMEKTWGEFGLNGASFDVLATLLRAGPPHALSPGDLIASTMVTSGTMTNRIDQLVKSGWVERVKNPNDGRGFLISLTPEGHKLISAAIAAHVETQHQLVAPLPEDQRLLLDQALAGFLAALQKSSA